MKFVNYILYDHNTLVVNYSGNKYRKLNNKTIF